jgi:hypothetical protein
MESSARDTLFPTLGPVYQRLRLVLAHLCRPFRQLYVAVSLRRLMVFVLVLGGLLGWYVRSVRVQRAAVVAIEQTTGSVFYDVQNRNDGYNFYYKPFGLKWLFDPRDLAPKWLVDRIGLDYTGAVVSAHLGHYADDDTMTQVGQLDRLESLGLGGTHVTDAGLVHLEGLTLLRDLNLGYTAISDAGLKRVRGLKELRVVDLWKTQVTDEGVLQLQDALPGLQILRDEDLAFGAAAPRAINDLKFARTQPIRLACLLLAHRADRAAHRGDKAGLLETANTICELEAADKISLLKVAAACASCLRSLELMRSADLPGGQKQVIEERLAGRGIAALKQAVDLGVKSLSHPPFFSYWPLSRYPGYAEIEARLGPRAPGDWPDR